MLGLVRFRLGLGIRIRLRNRCLAHGARSRFRGLGYGVCWTCRSPAQDRCVHCNESHAPATCYTVTTNTGALVSVTYIGLCNPKRCGKKFRPFILLCHLYNINGKYKLYLCLQFDLTCLWPCRCFICLDFRRAFNIFCGSLNFCNDFIIIIISFH